jgi:glycosyltransferase involved in cell wall biosynthesis
MREVEYSVVVPVYNEKGNISKLNKEIHEVLGKISKNYEVIYVDDGSNDGSFEELKEIKGNLIMQLNRNYGQATALDAGFKKANGRIVISLDGDGQNDPHDIPRLLEKMKKEDLDVVCGYRKERADKKSVKTLTVIGRFLRKKILHDNVHDTGCTLRVYKKGAVKSLDLQGEMHRYILALLKWKGFNIGEVVVNDRKREYGKSKYTCTKALRGFIDLIKMWFLQKYSQRPIHWFGALSILSFFLGTIITLWTIIKKITGGIDLSDNAWFVVGLFLFLSSITLFSFGLVLDLLIRTKLDVSKYENSYYVRKIVRT